eukprot:GHVP01037287.1.p1 GENE.GHVP01037287.1~~GHVP01037287.1.p1  ORF type:complete len:253 (+),score=33.62 GHVP01037287.1:293-1051(+)
MLSFYRAHMPQLGNCLLPLNRLIQKKVDFEWTQDVDEAFNKAKSLMSEAVVLVRRDETIPLVVTTDASEKGIGASLHQVRVDGTEEPLQFASRGLSSAEKNYSVWEKEALGVVWPVKKFDHYLRGEKFRVRTDHAALRRLKVANIGRVLRWSLALQEYDFEVDVVPGMSIPYADALSRAPDTQEMELAEGTMLSIEAGQARVRPIPVTRKIIEDWTKDHREEAEALGTVIDGVPHWRSRINVPIHLRKPLLE